MTQPKTNGAHHRVTVDLSWPKGHSVNDFLSSNVHRMTNCTLTYPTIDSIVEAIGMAERSGRAFIFKIDLERASQNSLIDPHDYPHQGLYWDD